MANTYGDTPLTTEGLANLGHPLSTSDFNQDPDGRYWRVIRGQKTYYSPDWFDKSGTYTGTQTQSGDPTGQGKGFFKQGTKYNWTTGRYENPTNWANVIGTLAAGGVGAGVAAPFIAGAVAGGAGGAGAGAAGTGASLTGTGAATGGGLFGGTTLGSTLTGAGIGAVQGGLQGGWKGALTGAGLGAIPGGGGTLTKTLVGAGRGALQGALSGGGVKGALTGAATGAIPGAVSGMPKIANPLGATAFKAATGAAQGGLTGGARGLVGGAVGGATSGVSSQLGSQFGDGTAGNLARSAVNYGLNKGGSMATNFIPQGNSGNTKQGGWDFSSSFMPQGVNAVSGSPTSGLTMAPPAGSNSTGTTAAGPGIPAMGADDGSGGFWSKYGPLIATGGGAVAGILGGRAAQNAAMQRSPEEAAALKGAGGVAGTAARTSAQLLGQARPYLRQAGGYYQTLLNGNRAAMSGAVAAPTAQLTDVYRGAGQALTQQGVRGAAGDVARGDLNRDRASKISGLVTGVQPAAAGALGTLGTGILGQSSGLLGTAGNLYGNLLNSATLNKIQAQQAGTQMGNTIGGLTADIANAIPRGGSRTSPAGQPMAPYQVQGNKPAPGGIGPATNPYPTTFGGWAPPGSNAGSDWQPTDWQPNVIQPAWQPSDWQPGDQ